MRTFKSISPRSLLAIVVMAYCTSVFGVDLLELPAIQSDVASKTLLLDVNERPDGTLVAVGTHGVIILSDDLGLSWEQSSVPASVTLTGVYFPTPEKGWAVGHDGLILHSTDGGVSWSKQLDGHQLNQQIVEVAELIVEQNQEALDALLEQEEPDEYAIEDAEFALGEAEFMLEGAMDDTAAGPVRPLLDVWFRNDNEGYVVGAYGMLLHTDDGGNNWELVSNRMDNPQAFHLNQISAAPDGTLFIAGEAGFVFRSMDGGMSWDTLEPGYEGSFYGILYPPNDDGGYDVLAYGLRGNLFVSSDQGESWEPLDSGTTITLTSGDLLEDGTVFLSGQGGTILVRSPGSETFNRAQNPDRRVISGALQMQDGNVLLVGLGGVRRTGPDGKPLNGATNTQ